MNYVFVLTPTLLLCMDLNEATVKLDFPFPWTHAGLELCAQGGDIVADFVDTGNPQEDQMLCALAAHCSQHLPKLIHAVYDYIEGPETHTAEALQRLRDAYATANTAPEFKIDEG